MVRTKSLLAATSCAFAIVVVGAGAASAGEVKPDGSFTAARTHANSICAYSGTNDDPGATTDPTAPPSQYPNGPGGHSQSFGQENRLGFVDPHVINPGDACGPGSNFRRVSPH